MELVQSLVGSLVGSGLVLAAFGWLVKRMLDHKLTGELESFKHELRAAHERELERLRMELRVSAHERETRFSRFHEKQVEVLAELYRRLVIANTTMSGMQFYARFGPKGPLADKNP